MTLTTDQIIAISEGSGSSLDTTCEGDDGHGPCGRYTDYTYDNPDHPTRVYCARGHEITLNAPCDHEDTGTCDLGCDKHDAGSTYCRACGQQL